jgi:hypothetical protein
MSIANIKDLLKSNRIEATTEQIKQKISELGLSASTLTEYSISQVVDAFIGANLAVTSSQSKSDIALNNQVDSAKKKIKAGLSGKLKTDIDAFEKPLADFSEQVSSDEALRIYEQHIASLPTKVISKTADLISLHQGDNKRSFDIGQQFAAALFSDFYPTEN